jgi:acetylornithine aminotransferase
MNTFGTPQRILVRGEGCQVWDNEGNRYLDLLGGIAVNVLGHAHPFLVSAVTAQLATLGHISNFFASAPQITLAERLLDLLDAPDGSRVFFTNSGTEAIEGAIKASRRTGRIGLIAAEQGFHGRSIGALSLTHKLAYRQPFEPLLPAVRHVPFGQVEPLADELDPTVAAVILEPIQGEAGVRVPSADYLPRVGELTRANGSLLILDEVQTGIGRTGHWFAHQNPELGLGLRPDLITLAKGLAGGLPIGALIGLGHGPAELLGPGQHGSTFGGNPVACAAALATLHVLERDELLPAAAALGERFKATVNPAACDLITEVRGHGLLLAVELAGPIAADVAAKLLTMGYIVNASTPQTLRLAPALIITSEQLLAFGATLLTVLDEYRDHPALGH